MNQFLKLSKQSSTILLCVLCCFSFAQKDEACNKQLSVKIAFVSPVYYEGKVFSYYENKYYTVHPYWKPSYNISIQYKTKNNLLFGIQFQPYNIGYQINNMSYTYHISHLPYTEYYTVEDRYKLYNISAGIGAQSNIGKKSLFGFSVGASLFFGDHGDYTIIHSKYTYTSSYIAPHNEISHASLSKITPYINIFLGRKLFKSLYLSAGANYNYLSWRASPMFSTKTIEYRWFRFLSADVGVRYNIVNKATKTKKEN